MIADRQIVDGVVIGMILGFREAAPLVVFPGNAQIGRAHV